MFRNFNWMRTASLFSIAICLAVQLHLMLPATAVTLVKPYFFEPFDTVNDKVKITGIGSRPDATSNKLIAVGTHLTTVGSEYVLFSMKITDNGNSGFSYQVKLSWKMTPALTEDVNPKAYHTNNRYMIWYQLPSTKDIYLFDTGKDSNNVNGMKVNRVTLPLAFRDSFRIGYVEKYTGFVGVGVNQWWFAQVKSERDQDFKCEMTQPDPLLTVMTTCGSCGIVGDQNDQFVIGGKFQNRLQLMTLKKDNCDYEDDMQVELPAAYTTADWFFEDAYRQKLNGFNFYAAITRKQGDDKVAILYLTKKDTASDTYSEEKLKEVSLPDSIAHTKVQLDKTSGQNVNPYFMFITAANKVVMFQMKEESGPVYHFMTYDYPMPPNANGLVYHDFAYYKEHEGGIIVGEALSFEDLNGDAVTAVAQSGFFHGFDSVNSCTIYDVTWAPTDETPNPYGAISVSHQTDTNGVNLNDNGQTLAISKLQRPAEFDNSNFRLGNEYNEIQMSCSAPAVTPPIVADQYYVIQSTSYNLDVTYGAFTYGPAIFLAQGYSFTTYEQTATPTGSDPFWANLQTGNSWTRIATTNAANAGQYAFNIRAYLDNEAYPNGSFGDSLFKVFLIEIVTITVSDMKHSMFKTTDTIQSTTSWSLNPSTGGNMPSYSLNIWLVEQSDGVTPVPSWIYFTASGTGTDKITIDYLNAIPGSYTYVLKAEVVDDLGVATGKFASENFKVDVYRLTASTAIDQIYFIDDSLDDYTFDAFTCDFCTSAGFNLAYTIEVPASGANALTFYPWVNSFNAATRKISFKTSDVAQAGQYSIRIKGALDDSPTSTVETVDFQVYVITIAAQAQPPKVYLLGNPTMTEPINAFVVSPTLTFDAPGATWTYSLSQVSGNSLITTVTSADILIGQVTSISAGSVLGPITDSTKAGTSVYRITATLSGSINSISIPSTASSMIDFNIHIVEFTMTAIPNILTPVGLTAAQTEPFAISYVPVHAEVPNYAYQCQLLEDSGSVFSTPTYLGVQIDTSSGYKVSVQEADSSKSGRYTMKVQCQPTADTAYMIEKNAFQVDIYALIPSSPQTQYHLIGPLQMDYTIPSFTLTHSQGFLPSVPPFSYSLTMSNGSSLSTQIANWLSINSSSGKITISASSMSDTGVYDFIITGTLADFWSSSTSASIKIHNVGFSTTATFPTINYRVTAHPLYFSEAVSFTVEPIGSYPMFQVGGYSISLYDRATNSYTAQAPDFLTIVPQGSSQSQVAISTDESNDAGLYKLELNNLLKDTSGLCPQSQPIGVKFRVLVFTIKTQPLENQNQTITYRTVTYKFPRFLQTPKADFENIISEIDVKYSLSLVSYDNQLIQKPLVSDFAKIFNNEVILIQTDDLSLVGNYTLALNGYYEFSRGLDNRTEFELFNVTLKKPSRTYTEKEAQHQYFTVDDVSINYTEAWSLTIGGIHPIYGKQGNVMNIQVDLGKALDFVTYEQDQKTLTIDEGSMTWRDVGSYNVTVLAHYSNVSYSESYSTSFMLTVRNDNPPIKVNLPKPKSVREWVQQNNFFVPSLDQGPKNPEQPIPYIKDLSSTGQLVIRWDRSMQKLEEFSKINPSRVAVQNQNKTSEDPYSILDREDQRRNLNYRYYDFLNNEKLLQEWFLIIESLEIKLLPSDFSEVKYLNLTWEMQSFDSNEIEIQLWFEHPSRVSETMEFDTLEVSFWGTDFFKSEDGESVRFGTRLERKIARQVSPSTGRAMVILGQVLAVLTWTVCLFAIFISGRLLATWMFLNSLQLITHSVLCVNNLPAQASIFMRQLLYLSRFNPFPFGPHYMESPSIENSLNANFAQYAYTTDDLLTNLNWISLVLLSVLSVLLLTCLKDMCCPMYSSRQIFLRQKHLGLVFNGSVRVLYQLFFELVFCAMLGLLSDSEKTQYSTQPPVIDRSQVEGEQRDTMVCYSLIAGCAMLLLIALSFAWKQFACCCCKIKRKNELTRVQSVCEAISQWCTNICLIRRLRKEDKKRKQQEQQRSIFLESLNKGAEPQRQSNSDKENQDESSVRAHKRDKFRVLDEEKGLREQNIENLGQLFISSPWIRGVEEPKPHFVSTKAYVMDFSADSEDQKESDHPKVPSQSSQSLQISEDSIPEKKEQPEPQKEESDQFDASVKFVPQLIRLSSFKGLEWKTEQDPNSSREYNDATRGDLKDNKHFMYDNDNPTAHVTPLAMQENDYDSRFDSMTAFFDVKSHGASQTRFKYAETIMKLEDENFELLEGGSTEYSKRLIERLFELKSKAFFNVAQSTEVEVQIKHTYGPIQTIWLGLHFQAYSQLAFIYPVLFLIRRIFLSTLLIYGHSTRLGGGLGQLCIYMYTGFAMLILLSSAKVWSDPLIQVQHLMNEFTLVVLCFAMILQSPGFSDTISGMFYKSQSEFIVIVTCLFILANLGVIIYDQVYNWYNLVMQRKANIIAFRQKYRHDTHLINKRNYQKAKQLKDLKTKEAVLKHRKQTMSLKRKFLKRLRAAEDNDNKNTNNKKSAFSTSSALLSLKDQQMLMQGESGGRLGKSLVIKKGNEKATLRLVGTKSDKIQPSDLTKVSVIDTSNQKLMAQSSLHDFVYR